MMRGLNKALFFSSEVVFGCGRTGFYGNEHANCGESKLVRGRSLRLFRALVGAHDAMSMSVRRHRSSLANWLSVGLYLRLWLNDTGGLCNTRGSLW